MVLDPSGSHSPILSPFFNPFQPYPAAPPTSSASTQESPPTSRSVPHPPMLRLCHQLSVIFCFLCQQLELILAKVTHAPILNFPFFCSAIYFLFSKFSCLSLHKWQRINKFSFMLYDFTLLQNRSSLNRSALFTPSHDLLIPLAKASGSR